MLVILQIGLRDMSFRWFVRELSRHIFDVSYLSQSFFGRLHSFYVTFDTFLDTPFTPPSILSGHSFYTTFATLIPQVGSYASSKPHSPYPPPLSYVSILSLWGFHLRVAWLSAGL
jgi:hypothetical protein